MRIQVLSDLHFEYFQAGDPRRDLAAMVRPDVDVAVLAGDIDVHVAAAAAAAQLERPVVQIAGNHEFYGHAIDPPVSWRPTVASHVRWLENETTVVSDVRFLGCVLWTDYRLFGSQLMSGATATRMLSDHRRIRLPNGTPFRAVHAYEIHAASRAWLEAELAKPWAGKTVVVTHHAPSARSVAACYADDPLTPAFASNLESLAQQADLWIHGHMHHSCDYKVGRCRVVCNPRGYPRGDVAFENPSFTANFVVDL